MTSTTMSLVDLVRDVARERIAPGAAAVDAERAFPRAAIDALAEQGALGLMVPETAGGAGGGLTELVQACEAVGSACASSGMVFLMHNVTAATVAAGGGERANAFLEQMAAGTVLGSLAFSERGTGAHFYAPELAAERENGGVRIAGRKSFVTSGGEAQLYLVLVRSGDGEGLDCYAVTPEDGVTFDGAWEGLGMAGNSSVAAQFDAQIDDAARVGEAGGGAGLVFGAVAPVFLAGLAAVNVGIAAAAQQAAIEHAAGRTYPGGDTLAEIQSVQHALAALDMATRAVGRVARRPVGGGARPARRHGAGGRAGHDVHRPERIRRALRAGSVPSPRQPGLRGDRHVTGGPHPRRGPPHRGLHEARAHRRLRRPGAGLDRAVAQDVA